MAHSSKKLKKMIERQKAKIEIANPALEKALASGDAKEVRKIKDAIASHRSCISRWQKEISRRDRKRQEAIQANSSGPVNWSKSNHSKAEKRASTSDRESAWMQVNARRKLDIIRRTRKANQAEVGRTAAR